MHSAFPLQPSLRSVPPLCHRPMKIMGRCAAKERYPLDSLPCVDLPTGLVPRRREEKGGNHRHFICPEMRRRTNFLTIWALRTTDPAKDESIFLMLPGYDKILAMPQPITSWPWPLAEFRADCPCLKLKCDRRGRCRECYGYHGPKGRLPRCVRKGSR